MQRRPIPTPSLALALALALAPTLAGPARAAPVSPDQAKTLATSLQDWLVATLGPGVKLPPDLITVAPDGAAYRLSLPVPMLEPAGGKGPATLSLAARPLKSGAWAIGDVRVPSHLLLHLPTPAAPAPAPGQPAPTAAPSARIDIANLDIHGVFDPSFTHPSVMVSAYDGLSYGANYATLRQTGRLQRVESVTRLVPGAGGLLTLSGNSNLWGYRVHGDAAGISSGTTIAHVGISSRIDGLSPAALTGFLHTITALAMASQAPAGAAKPAPTKSAALQQLFSAAAGVISGLSITETMDGFAMHATGKAAYDVEIAHLVTGLRATAPKAQLAAHLLVVIDGLHSSAIPPAFAALVPSHIVLRPYVAGIDLPTLTQAAVASAMPGAGPAMMMPALMGMLAKGGVKVGIDQLALDIGPARLRARGRLTILGMPRAQGSAVITVARFGALMKTVSAMPQGAAAVPMLVMLRGLAKPVGHRLVWHVSVDPAGKVLINGIDASTLAPHGPPGGGQMPGQMPHPVPAPALAPAPKPAN